MTTKLVTELLQEKAYPEALLALDPLMREEPDDPRLYFLYGQIMLESEKPALAYRVFKELSVVEPRRDQVWVNLGKCLDDLHRQPEAQECYKRALKINPNSLQAKINMSSSAVQECNYDKALHWANVAEKQDPSVRSIHVNRGFALLLKGDYQRGWTEYEYGLGHTKWRDEHVYDDEPRWDGSPGKTVVVYGEQGIGDQIAFCGCINEAKQDANIILNVAPKLKNLFARSFGLETHGDQFERELDWPYDRKDPIQASCSVTSLQKYYRDDKARFTGKPYLVADPVRRVAWRAILDGLGDRPNIGIAWTGGNTETQRQARSTSLEALRPIFEAVDANWIDLEYKDRSEDLEAFDVPIHSYPWATQTKDYDDTAALVAELDLVISVPTSVVHLAGGLGVECWCMLNRKNHFVFGIEGEGMDWYESVRLFRRDKDEWTEQVQSVADQLRGWYETRRFDSGRTGAPGIVRTGC